MARRKTNEEFVKEVKNLVGDEYAFLEEYKGALTKIKCRHNKCGYEWDIQPTSFLRGTRCPKCMDKLRGNKNSLSYEYVKYYIEIESGSECKLLSKEYINSNTKLIIQCKCGKEFQTNLDTFKYSNKRKCEFCSGKIKWDHDKVKYFIEVRSNSGCKLLSEEYLHAKSKLKIQCECGNEFETTIDLFRGKNKRTCNMCSKIKMSKLNTKTHNQYIMDVKDKFGDKYDVLSRYKNAKSKIKVKHNECGYIWDVNANSFLTGGSKCPRCAGKTRDTETFKREIRQILGDEYELLNEYKKIDYKVKIKHLECNKIYEVIPASIIHQESRCPYCYGNNRKTTQQFKQEVHDLVGDEYVIFGEYTNNKTKINIKHTVCGHKYSVRPSNFSDNGRRCPKCYGKNSPTTSEFKEIIRNLPNGNEYEVENEYKNIHNKIKFRHKTCGRIFYMLPGNFIHNNQRCPHCRESKGEKKLSNHLNLLKIEYKKQYKFKDCIGKKRRMPFDFATFNNDNLIFLIEYDGEYHYQPIVSEKQLKIQQQNDNIKNQYCKDNNIPLLRIPYWEFDNIEQILEEWLEKHGVLQKDRNTA